MTCCFLGEFTWDVKTLKVRVSAYSRDRLIGEEIRYLIILWNNNIKDTCSNFNQFASNIASRTCQVTKDILLTLLADAGTCTTSSLCDNRDSTYRNRKTQVNEDHKWSNRCPVHLFNFRGPSREQMGGVQKRETCILITLTSSTKLRAFGENIKSV